MEIVGIRMDKYIDVDADTDVELNRYMWIYEHGESAYLGPCVLHHLLEMAATPCLVEAKIRSLFASFFDSSKESA